VTKGEKRAMWIAGVVILLIILYLLLRKGNNTNINQEGAPTYTNYNLSPGSWNGTASGLPSIQAANPSSCGCSGGATTSGFFNSLQDMLNTFMAGSTAAFNNYENNVYANQPSFVQQYFNNPAGVALANANASVLTGA
jgi:hypothetical protein